MNADRGSFEAMPGEERAYRFYDEFYEAVKDLTNKAFRMETLKIDFVNAEDLERLLEQYNPNPTEEDEDSYDRSDPTPDSSEGEVPAFELPDADGSEVTERP